MSSIVQNANAWVCTDCLLWHANGVTPEDSGYDDSDWSTALIEENLKGGYSITIGHGVEEHSCKSNYTVTVDCAPYEVWSDNADRTEALEAFVNLYGHHWSDEPDESGEFTPLTLTIVRHAPATAGDLGTDCDCETIPFDTRDCDSCGRRFGDEWHAATVWQAVGE